MWAEFEWENKVACFWGFFSFVVLVFFFLLCFWGFYVSFVILGQWFFRENYRFCKKMERGGWVRVEFLMGFGQYCTL